MQGRAGTPGDLELASPSLKILLSPATLMPLVWIKLFWTCYCNDSPINCTGVLCCHVLKCNPDFLMSVLLNNFWLNI